MHPYDPVLAFWFGAETSDEAIASARAALWWSKDAAIDADVRERFGALIEDAAQHRLDDWRQTPAGRLALILLTDQFPRNAMRDLPASFAFDVFALAFCKEGLRDGADRHLRPIERIFFYLPLEHSEAIADQEQAVALMAELASGATAAARATFDGFLRYAQRHREVIQRFGRFPHRNRILGRTSTPEEVMFLTEKGSSF